MSVLAKMILAGNPRSIDNLELDSDKKLARILTEIQERDDMVICREQEIINGAKIEMGKTQAHSQETSSSFDFGERWIDNPNPANMQNQNINDLGSKAKSVKKLQKKFESSKQDSPILKQHQSFQMNVQAPAISLNGMEINPKIDPPITNLNEAENKIILPLVQGEVQETDRGLLQEDDSPDSLPSEEDSKKNFRNISMVPRHTKEDLSKKTTAMDEAKTPPESNIVIQAYNRRGSDELDPNEEQHQGLPNMKSMDRYQDKTFDLIKFWKGKDRHAEKPPPKSKK